MAVIFGILGFVATLVYIGKLGGGRGQTLGQQALGIRMIDAATAQPIGAGRAIGRYFATFLSAILCYLGYFWMLWDPQKQTWHDKIVEQRRRQGLIQPLASAPWTSRRSPTTRSCSTTASSSTATATSRPTRAYELDGHDVRTLARPPRRAAGHGVPPSTTCTSARSSAASSTGSTTGPIYRSAPGDEPYPEVMNRGRRRRDQPRSTPTRWSSRATSPSMGTRASTSAFLDAYGRRSATGCIHVRGNHDAYHGEDLRRRGAAVRSTLPGVTPGRARHGDPRSAPAGGVTDRAARLARPAGRRRPTGRCSSSATTTRGTPDRPSGPRRLLRHQPRRLRAPGRGRGPPARASSATSPATPTATGCAGSRPPATCRGSRWRA